MHRYDEFGDVATDPVTGLYRLGANGPSLATAVAAAGATRRKVALLHIDIDMFRSINTNMGVESEPSLASCNATIATSSRATFSAPEPAEEFDEPIKRRFLLHRRR